MSDVVYTHSLDWKEGFNVNLSTVKTEITAIEDSCCGLSADVNLRAHFTAVPIDDNKTAIDSYWAGLNTGSVECTSYVSAATIQSTIDAARLDAVTKDWDALSVAQKKLIAGITPTIEELGL